MKTDQNSSRSPLSPKPKRRLRRSIWILAPLVCIGAVVVYVVVWFSSGPNLRAEGIASMTLVAPCRLVIVRDDGSFDLQASFNVVEADRMRAILAVLNGTRRTLPSRGYHDGKVVIKYSDGSTVTVKVTGAGKGAEGGHAGRVRIRVRNYHGLKMSMPELFALGGWDVAEAVVPLFVEALRREESRGRTRMIVEELVMFGEDAVGELTKALDDEDERVRKAAKEALEKIRREAGH